MKKRSKKYVEAFGKVDKTKFYSKDEALKLVKETSISKFDGSVEVAVRLNLDTKKADQQLRGAVLLPKGTGKVSKILVIAKGPKATEAKEAGADYVGDTDMLEKIEKENWFDFDTIIATPDMMPALGKIGKVLGPKGLMPNPKTGTVTMDIKKAEFTLSAPMVSMCPADNKPEYAFIGRSNVGKSSLINMLTNNKRLAKTSSTPGKTLLINHFIINNEWYLVDLPGYGYAKRSKKEIDKLDQMIRGYILQREQLVNVFVLVDIRLEPQKIDLDFLEWLGLSSIPFSIVFTKADKLTATKARQSVETYKKVLMETWEELPPIFVTSAEKRQGRDEVLDYIEQINKELRLRDNI